MNKLHLLLWNIKNWFINLFRLNKIVFMIGSMWAKTLQKIDSIYIKIDGLEQRILLIEEYIESKERTELIDDFIEFLDTLEKKQTSVTENKKNKSAKKKSIKKTK